MTTLRQVFWRNGGVRGARLPQAASIVFSALGRWPFSAGERLYMASRKPAISEALPPVFIVGHWRSGTTHLYNLLNRAEDYGTVTPLAAGLPWDLLGLVRALQPALERLLPKDRFIDNIPVLPDSPQEDELALANMGSLSYYHALYFPQRFTENLNAGLFFEGCTAAEVKAWQERFLYFLSKLQLYHGPRRLIVKNPVYTARMGMIQQLLPQAKFIHIHRDPLEVFRSMQKFYRRLFEELSLQHYDHVAIDEAILSVYPRMMDRFIEDRVGLAKNQFVEISYRHLSDRPLDALREIYETLDLPNYTAHEPAFAAYLDSIRSYEKNVFRPNPEALRTVGHRWQPYFERWGYRLPEAPGLP